MFTITEVNAAKPPNSPIGTGTYWDGILLAAEQKVKDICRRQLESASYTDIGYTIPVDNDNTRAYVWYLSEPTGTALEFSALSAFTLDDDTVDSTDVTIEVNRLVFNSAGEVKVTYAGGYMANATAKTVLKQAVIATMHALHKALQDGGKPDLSAVIDLLQPYTAAVLMTTGYVERPD